MKTTQHVIHEINDQLAAIQGEVPKLHDFFLNMTNELFHDDSAAENHKIALAIALYSNSKDCIKYHLGFLLKNGFKKADYLQLLNIVTYMGGGISLAAGLKQLKHFAQEQK